MLNTPRRALSAWRRFNGWTAELQGLLPTKLALVLIGLGVVIVYGVLYALAHVAWLAYVAASVPISIGVAANLALRRRRGPSLSTSRAWWGVGAMTGLLVAVLPMAINASINVAYEIAPLKGLSVHVGLADALAGLFVLLFSLIVGVLSFIATEIVARDRATTTPQDLAP